MALVFWKDSLDFTRIIKQQRDQVDPRGGSSFAGSPDRKRSTYSKKAAEEAIAQYKGKNPGPPNANGSYVLGQSQQRNNAGPSAQGRGQNAFDMGRR